MNMTSSKAKRSWVQLKELFLACTIALVLVNQTIAVNCGDNPRPCLNGATGCLNLGNGTIACTCAKGFQGPVCADAIQACESSPCANGATCSDLIKGFHCDCRPGYTGRTCSTDIDECASSPCGPYGVCNDTLNAYTCACRPGFRGPTCALNVDDCVDRNGYPVCRNGGRCVDGVDDFHCVCNGRGYEGRNCHREINECLVPGFCNRGTCTNEPMGSYTCTCEEGFEGSRCDTIVQDCRSRPDACANGATCVDGQIGFTCRCPPGLMGSRCEVNLDDCKEHSCKHGGTCVDGVNGYRCICRRGYRGIRCETVKTPSPASLNRDSSYSWSSTSLESAFDSLDLDVDDTIDGLARMEMEHLQGKKARRHLKRHGMPLLKANKPIGTGENE